MERPKAEMQGERDGDGQGWPEAYWAASLAAGSDAALQAIYKEYGSLIYSIALKVLEDAYEAEEVTQDVFVKAWKNRQRFDARRSTLRGWLCVMTRSGSLDRLRRRRVRPDQSKSHQVELEQAFGLGAPDELGRSERLAALQASLEKIRPEYRSSLELSYFKGYSQKEIADLLGVPEGTVKSFIRRGLIKLREAFAQQ